ncbi:hypothetical protein [Desulfosoma caldarium]|uniref:Uncharacterized protein n=1 Tax=Desulfosoma caldarium TaxID=610254 RepID=A0A3N1UHH9_9BACT|nr:hypothetical protein [Desulfosoma caldarium]ROQ90714.1 hypothetical protein EDC27_2604 [Desulfosoma caldarium]
MNIRFEVSAKHCEELQEDKNTRFEQPISFLNMLASIYTTLRVAVIAFAHWGRRTMIHDARTQTLDFVEREATVWRIVLALNIPQKTAT